jgi:arsenate reductase (thioredoxin)
VKYILFVCTHNAGRSQMAQAFWRRHAPADVPAESAGQEPARAPWPEVVRAMAEIGIDISNERPKKLDLEMQLHADWAITLGCGGACPYVPTRIDDWEIADPRGQPIDVVRAIRDDLERRVVEFIDTRLDEIRRDRTAHQRRLARILPALDSEFGETHGAEEIRACTDAILDRYDEAPVRSMIETIAYREARECLHTDRCGDVLATG